MMDDADTRPQKENGKEEPEESPKEVLINPVQSSNQEKPTKSTTEHAITQPEPVPLTFSFWKRFRCRFKLKLWRERRRFSKKRREKAKWTDIVTLVLTAAVAGAAIYSAWIFQGQLALLRDSDRPWIDVDIISTSPLTYDGNAVGAAFTIVPTNIGRSPAQNISINPNLTPAFMFDDLNEIQKRLCEGAANKSGMASLQYVLFPGHHYTQPVGMNIQVKDLDAHFGKMPPGQGPPDLIPIALVGCVDYTYESSDRHHQTAFAFDVLMKDQRIPAKSKTPLTPSDLILRSHPTSGHYPN